ncbi:Hypothetical protein NTJ_08374 [Nesidiocoris tenuis]|uniref:Uncharacterized protein n=1 Tax=Nesidiocoris tenuis TaxID=355587 RepID=A0ABN7ATM5_9HEMI|nr:Hypothetical protein NTJ_08374 [Nesidiocoris tenuis]
MSPLNRRMARKSDGGEIRWHNRVEALPALSILKSRPECGSERRDGGYRQGRLPMLAAIHYSLMVPRNLRVGSEGSTDHTPDVGN